MKEKKLPTILALVILVFGTALGVILVQSNQIFKLGASPQLAPKDIRITNITDSIFTISWITEKETSAYINWGENQDLKNTSLDKIEDLSFTHTVSVQGLKPETEYYFEINSADKKFDNNGIPWQVKTGPEIAISEEVNLISGSVLTATQEPAVNVLVYVNLAGASPLSTSTSQGGNWIISLSAARSVDLSSLAPIDPQSTIAEISVQAGPDGVATAKIYPAAANPAPPIILGQVHDFRNITRSDSSEIPESSIEVPKNLMPTSGFEVPEETPASIGEIEVSLQSLDEGEIITSTNPEFFGEGPPGTTITITIESAPVTDEITIGSFSSWSWSPPNALSEGVHKITISWKDSSGILRTITRNFVVQAAEGPAFESTPSGATSTPTATPTVTNTPTPTNPPTGGPTSSVTTSPTPTITTTTTPTPTPTATPTSELTPTSTPEIPESGSLTPTIAGSIMGLGLIIFSGVSAGILLLKEN